MTCKHMPLMKWRALFIYLFILFIFVPKTDQWTLIWPRRWFSGIISDGKQMLHKFFPLLWVKEWAYIHGGGHFEFYARWPPEIDHNLFAMVFEILMPIPATMPNLKNLAPSARSIWIPPPLRQPSQLSGRGTSLAQSERACHQSRQVGSGPLLDCSAVKNCATASVHRERSHADNGRREIVGRHTRSTPDIQQTHTECM